MARYAYDVNTTTRLIDVHKQFNGGLKTIDTDDSLGAVFLREAENISISEFGFLEKRYGTYEVEKMFNGVQGKLQGFWEYFEEDGALNEIAIIDGRLYLRRPEDETFNEITTFRKEGNFNYDETLFGTATPIDNYLPFTFLQSIGFPNPETGESNLVITNNASRTNKLYLTDIEGFNTLNKLKLNTNNFSYIVFYDESDNYLGYYGSAQKETYTQYIPDPNGPANIEVEIDLSVSKLGKKPIAGESFIVPLDAAYIQIVLDNSTYEEEDDDGNLQTYYVWGQESLISISNFENIVLTDTIGGTVYNLVEAYYPFQNEKEVSAVLIKEYLYIFNGTYPLYYKGGSAFFIFPVYEPSATDVINAGHNYLETRDFEEVYGFKGDLYKLDESDNFLDPSLDFDIEPEDSFELPITPRVSFTQQEWYPKLPYSVYNQEKGKLNFELNYNYSKETNKPFNPLEAINDSDYTNTNYNLRLQSLSYAAAGAASDSEFLKINPEKIDTPQPFTNLNQALDYEFFDSFKVRDENGLFSTLVAEPDLNNYPSPTHEGYTTGTPPELALNPESTKRNFLGKEVKHPYGLSELLVSVNERDLAISIEDTIIRTADNNLAGETFGFRFKRDITSGNTISYEKLNFKHLFGFTSVGGIGGTILDDPYGSLKQVNIQYQDGFQSFSYLASSVIGEDAALDLYLQQHFAIIVKPIVEGYISEDKANWVLLHDSENCYVQKQIFYFVMPEIADRIDGRPVTGYAVDFKTVDYLYLRTPEKREKYLQNYTGKAHRALRCIGQGVGLVGLKDLWDYKATRSKLDYNLFSVVTPKYSENNFGKPFKATVTQLIPGTYDFKLSFALDEITVPIVPFDENPDFIGTWDSSVHYAENQIARVFVAIKYKYYKSLEDNNHNNLPTQHPDKWQLLEDIDMLDRTSLETDTQYISVYFRNIQIFGEKIQDYKNIKEKGKSPVLSCTRAIEHYGKILLYHSEELEEAVFVSFPENFNYFPQLFRLDFYTQTRDPVESITPYMNVLVVQTPYQTWGIKGSSPLINSPDPYSTFMISPSYGTIAPKSVTIVRNQLMFLSHLGVVSIQNLYAVDNQYNVKQWDTMIKNILPIDADAIGIQYDEQYWLNFPNYGITLRWYIDKKAWVLDKYGAWNNFKGVFKYQAVNGNLQFITRPSNFKEEENLGIYKIVVDYSLPTDLGESILTKFETSFLNQNYPFHPKNYKELKLDFTIQNEYYQSQNVIYSMEENEHIVNDVHKIDNVDLIKNHRYRLFYNFSQHSIDETVLDGGTFTQVNYPEQVSGGVLAAYYIPIKIGGFTFSLLGAQDLQIQSVKITDKDNNQLVLLPNEDFTIVEDAVNFNEYVDFLLPHYVDGVVDIIVDGEFSIYNDGAVLYDITYDQNLIIKNWVVSEDSTLNVENINSYEPSQIELPLDYDSTLGNWTFGSSDFGNKVTAVKTVKLAGKGYNAKLYLEDATKSKWTLESLGLTYKMKRARSR